MLKGFFVANRTWCKCLQALGNRGEGVSETRLLDPSGGEPGGHVRHWLRHRRLHSGTWCELWGQGGRMGPCGEEVGTRGAASVAESEENSLFLFYTLPVSFWGVGLPSAPLPHRTP